MAANTPSRSAERFSTIARNYATSEVHRSSPTMRMLHELLGPQEGARMLDVACGAGHLGLSFLPQHPAEVTFLDPAEPMLEHVALALAEQPASDTETRTLCATAEEIPLPPASYDVVMTRLAAHHFTDTEQAVRTMAGLLRPGGRLAVIDLEGPEDPELAAFNHEIEVLHDPTHGRSHSRLDWIRMLQAAGLNVPVARGTQSESPSGVPVARWCQITAVGDEAAALIRARLAECGPETRAALGIRERDGEYLIPVRTVLVVGVKPLGAI
ncbi:class I SAM-dependent methyltransferase [Actinacidiphila paucisporea]|uniref:Methyltransferase domain-containing protein n=1 Tax=Actinacidiphila paucisporea TaxID=310782 RepID=A0A1M7HAC9_9ACTN|nr:class I SAM-dependent methyltransferase [Actinacidiphila paucisporea]SHM25532.1 Methyltransferase domain-containing protein [Actinacidiphila paucisporea]